MYLMSFEHTITIAMVLYFGVKLSNQCRILVGYQIIISATDEVLEIFLIHYVRQTLADFL